MFNLYFVKDNYGRRRLMSAKKVCSLVSANSDLRDKNWQLNAENLIELCDKKHFPREYGFEIQTNILDFYGNLLYWNDSILESNRSNLDAVCKLYNDFYGVKDKNVKKSRADFLDSYLFYITNAYRADFSEDKATFNKAEVAWRKEKHEKYINRDFFDFDEKFEPLNNSFAKWLTRLVEGGFLKKNASKKNKFSFKHGSTSKRTSTNDKPKKRNLSR